MLIKNKEEFQMNSTIWGLEQEDMIAISLNKTISIMEESTTMMSIEL